MKEKASRQIMQGLKELMPAKLFMAKIKKKTFWNSFCFMPTFIWIDSYQSTGSEYKYIHKVLDIVLGLSSF